MSIGSLLTIKDSASTAQPLLLATISFSDGTVLRLSTHDLTGSLAYGGNDYAARILNQEIAASQALSEQGIDVPAMVSLRLSDADYDIWLNYEKLKGFKGSSLELRAVMFDVLVGDYSSDSRVIFRGVCKEPGGRLPSHDGKVLTVGYVSKMQMGDISLPSIKIQKTCPWTFPTTASARQDAADNPHSESYQCGYSPDASGGNARGNLNGGSPFTTCNYTKEDCIARGMYIKDSSNRVTGRFGGIQWNEQTGSTVREYITGKWIQVQGGANEARYGDNVPMLFGTQWTDPLILNTVPGANLFKMEVLICYGPLDYIHEVIVNDVVIRHTYNDSWTAVSGEIADATEATTGGWWTTVNHGDRDGSPNIDKGYVDKDGNPVGDPYGSLAVIEIVVPTKVANSGSLPRVRVRAAKGVPQSEDDGGYNPATLLAEILQEWTAWDTADLNASSFTAAEAVCDGFIGYTDQRGVSASRRRFTAGMYLRQRESAAEIIRGIRNGMRGILSLDENGLLRLRVKQTIAAQQPSPVPGSNYNVLTNGGYPAYKFDESNILESPSVSEVTAGNKYSIQFQNRDNRWAWDAFSPLDSEDIERSGQEIPGSFIVRGPDNYDQLQCLVATWTAEQYRGNWRDDSGGTLQFDFPISIRGVHLSIGDICVFNWQPLGVSNQLVRVVRIQPETNFERARITVTWHKDEWYDDTYGQTGQPGFVPQHRNRLLRPAFSWLPYGQQPESGDSIVAPTEWGFSIAQKYELAADGTTIAKLAIGGRQIVNVTISKPYPPFVPFQGSTANSGGSIRGGRAYYLAFAAKDSAGNISPRSELVVIGVPSGTDTNTLTVNNVRWDTGTTGYICYAGEDPNKLSAQVEASGTPSSVTLTSLYAASWGAPDGEFDRYRIRAKRIIHGGNWGAQVIEVTSTTIKVGVPESGGFTTNQWAGYDVTWLGTYDSEDPIPICSFRVESNTEDTLTLAVGSPDPSALGLEVFDVLVMRSKPTVGAGYIEDANWVNCFGPDGLAPDAEIGNLCRIISGKGRGQVARISGNTATRIYVDFAEPPDSNSRYIIEEPSWQVISDTVVINNEDPGALMTALVDVNNYQAQTLLVQVLTVDGGDTESNEPTSPIREIYLYGQLGNYGLIVMQKQASTLLADNYDDSYMLMAPNPDTGAVEISTSTAAGVRVWTPIGSTTGTGSQLFLHYDLAADFAVPAPGTAPDKLIISFKQDSTGGWSVTWDSIFQNQEWLAPDERPNSLSVFTFAIRAGQYWLISRQVGL